MSTHDGHFFQEQLFKYYIHKRGIHNAFKQNFYEEICLPLVTQLHLTIYRIGYRRVSFKMRMCTLLSQAFIISGRFSLPPSPHYSLLTNLNIKHHRYYSELKYFSKAALC